MNAVTIEKLKINPHRTLTGDSKRALVKIIEDEFHTQSTVYDSSAEAQRDKLLDQYRKGCGYTKLRADHDKATAQELTAKSKAKEIENQINLKGLTVEGHRHSACYGEETKPEMRIAIDKINVLFKTVEDMAPRNLRNKVISRLWLADTCGEACVILQQVLGKGIIPTMTDKLLLEHKE